MRSTTLERYLREKFGEVKKSSGRNGLELIVRCPVCGKKKLSVNAASGLYQCWRGCMTGHVQTLLGDIALAQRQAAPLPPAPLPANVITPGILVPFSELQDDHPAILYLQGRNLDPQQLDQFYGLRYCTAGQEFMGGVFDTTNTLIIPIWMKGVLVGWQSRLLYTPDTLDDDECEAMGYQQDPDGDWIRPPKYFTAPGIDKGRILYNYDWARQSDVVVVCEGAVDVWKVGRSAVGAFGKGVSDAQASLLANFWDIVVVMLDPGDAELEAARLSKKFAGIVNAVIPVMLKGYKDAGEAPQLKIWEQIGAAAHAMGIDLLQYKILL